ncbi:MAG: hypothetical protein D6681_23050 [Calditrichaeota bacterium]|nr:MAG: hypothetical protein D6681_23050 [Calditrichota bacterium]
METNVLRHLHLNENSVTNLVRALCVLKPLREIFVRLFTGGAFGAEDLDFDDISTQFVTGGGIPDLHLENDDVCVFVEVKVTQWCQLTTNQPENYLRELLGRPAKEKFFVFLRPPGYAHDHVYKNRRDKFRNENVNSGICFVEITWVDVLKAIEDSGLTEVSVYARDFCDLLVSMYVPEPISFTMKELLEVYDGKR